MNIRQERDTTTIRQTVTFNASPEAVYEVFMDRRPNAGDRCAGSSSLHPPNKTVTYGNAPKVR
jgi:hypothetical protein